MQTENQYSLIYLNCHFDAWYNTCHFPKSGNKWRMGMVVYKNKWVLFGNDPDYNVGVNISTRNFTYSGGHSWVETKDGNIIDWVINYRMQVSCEEKQEWTKDELKELGFEYMYYVNEDAIRNKTKRQLGGGCRKKKEPNEKCTCEYNQRDWFKNRITKDFFKRSAPPRDYWA